MTITILLGFNNSGKTTWMKKQNPDVWITGQKNKISLSDKDNVLVAFENPELGLHPNIHADLVTLIVFNAISKNQNIIIETHSEVMLLRIRRLVAMGKLNPSDVKVYWFEEYTDCYKDYLITIDYNGDLDTDLPKDVFDEDILELRGMFKKEHIRMGEFGKYNLPDYDEDNIRKITLDKKGYLNYFPDGVFEDCYKELLKISEIL